MTETCEVCGRTPGRGGPDPTRPRLTLRGPAGEVVRVELGGADSWRLQWEDTGAGGVLCVAVDGEGTLLEAPIMELFACTAAQGRWYCGKVFDTLQAMEDVFVGVDEVASVASPWLTEVAADKPWLVALRPVDVSDVRARELSFALRRCVETLTFAGIAAPDFVRVVLSVYGDVVNPEDAPPPRPDDGPGVLLSGVRKV